MKQHRITAMALAVARWCAAALSYAGKHNRHRRSQIRFLGLTLAAFHTDAVLAAGPLASIDTGEQNNLVSTNQAKRDELFDDLLAR